MHKVFTVYDSKIEAYGQPWLAQATGAAIRSFTDEVNRTDGQSPVAAHPEDFTLFEIGTWDELAGEIDMYHAKKSLGTGVDFRQHPVEKLSVAK